MRKARWFTLGVASVLAAVVAGAASGGHHSPPATVGTSFPAGFPTITDASLGTPVLGFGAAGRVKRTPVIFLHGNNDTPFPTTCNACGGQDPRPRAGLRRPRLLAERDLGARLPGRPVRPRRVADEPLREAHTTAANVDDLRALRAGGAPRTPARSASTSSATASAARSPASGCAADHAYHLVRHLVTIASPHHGIIDCSPSPLNYFALPALGGFSPNSAICVELGADRHAVPHDG